MWEKNDLANGKPGKPGWGGGAVLTSHDTDSKAKRITRDTGGPFVTRKGSALQEDKTLTRGCTPNNSFKRQEAEPGRWREEANPRLQLGVVTSLSQDG